MTISPEAFVGRLGAISVYKGHPYGRLHAFVDAEQIHHEAIYKHQGYIALSDAFKCFFLETMELYQIDTFSKLTVPPSEYYSIFIFRLIQSFRSICGAERLALVGYPYQAYSLLRNIFDHVVLISAALQNMTDFGKIEGFEPGGSIDFATTKKLRKKNEQQVRGKMYGKESALTPETQVELASWDSLFDLEVHGAALSISDDILSFVENGINPNVLPHYEDLPFTVFMNRCSEVGWMVHRLVPVIQRSDRLLSDSWKTKWTIIDESFEIIVGSLTQQLGKAIGGSMVEFVKSKFPFDQRSEFPHD